MLNAIRWNCVYELKFFVAMQTPTKATGQTKRNIWAHTRLRSELKKIKRFSTLRVSRFHCDLVRLCVRYIIVDKWDFMSSNVLGETGKFFRKKDGKIHYFGGWQNTAHWHESELCLSLMAIGANAITEMDSSIVLVLFTKAIWPFHNAAIVNTK